MSTHTLQRALLAIALRKTAFGLKVCSAFKPSESEAM